MFVYSPDGSTGYFSPPPEEAPSSRAYGTVAIIVVVLSFGSLCLLDVATLGQGEHMFWRHCARAASHGSGWQRQEDEAVGPGDEGISAGEVENWEEGDCHVADVDGCE